MTVLLVDDQISILSGLISGVNWDALGVTSIRTAGNAVQAKDILENERVDVLLCDIEMPGENGLSLLRWVRNKGMDLVCVFLTSHADFLYAKEAIQLDCFDYVLQPARYDEIQSTVARAISRVKLSREDKELEHYGVYAKNNPASLFQNLFSDWIAGNPLPVSRLRSILRQFHRDLAPGCDCAVVVGHLMRWHTEPWTTEEWVYGLNNIFSELYEAADCGSIPFSIDRTAVGWFLHAAPGILSKSAEPLKSLNSAYLRISQYFPCDFAFYVSPTVPVEQISFQAEKLLRAKKDNVLQKSGIFPLDEHKAQTQPSMGADAVQIRRWGDLLTEGDAQLLREEIFHYLDGFCNEGKLDYVFLHSFWLQFQQVVLNVLWHRRQDSKDLLPLLNRGEKAQSVQEMREVVKAVTAQFEQGDGLKDEKELVKQIEKYVDEHLDQPLNVADVADAMFMNPDYLSRLFKSKRGIPLKEYIVAEKMHAAQVLLQTTALPVGAIASKLGYDNYSYFSQAYRKVMGVSPTDERKK